jgi:hypothetical protein
MAIFVSLLQVPSVQEEEYFGELVTNVAIDNEQKDFANDSE